MSAASAATVDLSSFHLSPSSYSFYLWHSHLSHVSFSSLTFLGSAGDLRKLQTHNVSDCSRCNIN